MKQEKEPGIISSLFALFLIASPFAYVIAIILDK